IDIEFIYKKEGDFIRMTDARGIYAPVAVNALLPDGTATAATAYNRTSPSSQSLFEVVNRTDFDQDFKSFVFQLNKRFSAKWQALASYTYQNSQAYGVHPADHERLPASPRQGLQAVLGAAPRAVARRLQRVQPGDGADPAEQRVAGDRGEPVRADAHHRAAADAADRGAVPVLSVVRD